MSTVDLVNQLQQLDKRLTQVEEALLRLERLLMNLQASQPTPKLTQPIRFASPRLARREQAADFIMVVTREQNNAS
jgi:hypothetical protein